MCVCGVYVGVSVCVCSALLSVHLPEFVLLGMRVCVHISVRVTCSHCDLAVPVIFSFGCIRFCVWRAVSASRCHPACDCCLKWTTCRRPVLPPSADVPWSTW